ncbi:MAG: TIGR00153 family protein [Gammaproteobacteria bacterium]|jgi:predicted phosphate transport protein (TIGR00153 family)|nr:TIGR00153 family protein [Gammaproteobacteria bacterium]
MSNGNTFSKLFGQSPFTALQEHMRVVVDCARDVQPLIEALVDGDQVRVNELKDRIFEQEAEADRIKHELRARLPKSLFMPVDRRDLLEVLLLQDTIANVAQDIAGLLVERKMSIPDFLRDPLLELTARCIDTVEHSARVIEELDELLAIGFRGREVDRVDEMLRELNRIEDETDELGIALARALFDHEDELKPVSVMMWYQIIEWIGDLADYAEKVGDHLRLLIAK